MLWCFELERVVPGLSGSSVIFPSPIFPSLPLSSFIFPSFALFTVEEAFNADETFCPGTACWAATGNGIPATNTPPHTTHTSAFFHASIATSDAQMNYLAGRLQIRQPVRNRIPRRALGFFDRRHSVETARCFVSALEHFEQAIDAHEVQDCRRCRRECGQFPIS